MSARSSPSSRSRRAPALAALALIILGPQCSFPQHTFFEEDCYNGKDDDVNGQVDCEDTACKQKVICVPPLPAYWFGPVVVWEGRGTEEIPDCDAFAYREIAYHPLYAGEPRLSAMDTSQTCPRCPCAPSPTSAHCEAKLTICEDAACQHPAGGVNTPHVVTTKCSPIQVDGSDLPKDGYYAKAQGPTVSGGCQPLAAPYVGFPLPVWDYKLRACDVTQKIKGCGERNCLDIPPEPLSRAVCVYKVLDAAQNIPLTCPVEYPEQLPVYSQATDSRACSDCACDTTGMSCSSTTSAPISVGDFGSSADCGSSRFELPLNTSSPIKVGTPMVYPLNVKLTPVEPSGYPECEPSPRTLTGSVTRGQSVAFCCTHSQ